MEWLLIGVVVLLIWLMIALPVGIALGRRLQRHDNTPPDPPENDHG